jgi:hypothetical protein
MIATSLQHVTLSDHTATWITEKIASSEMLYGVALERTDVSEELRASIIRMQESVT